MEKRKLVLKREKKKSGIYSLFADKKKRYLLMLACILPFLIAIGVFGSVAYREAKNLIDLAKNNGQIQTKDENLIASMNYILRDNPTDLQKEYFAELKEAIEGEEPADKTTIAGLVAKNYVADFYTWTNKRGQYDIGGFYYIYQGEYENSHHYKENLFLKAKDGFYKYISYYGTLYGKENLIEVDNVELLKCEKMNSKYVINEHSANKQDENGEWYDYRVDEPYDWYYVECKWTYKENTTLPMNQFATSINLAIIDRAGRLEIVEASEKKINARTGSEKNTSTETSEVTETTSETTTE